MTYYYVLQYLQTDSEALPVSYSVGTSSSFPGLEQAWHQVDRSYHLEPYLCLSGVEMDEFSFLQTNIVAVYFVRDMTSVTAGTSDCITVQRATTISAALLTSLFLSYSRGAQQ